MKTQAWGWLATAVLAAGLNSSYHNGGLQWAHEIAGRVQHNTGAVLALATGNANRFLAEAQLARAQSSPSCPVSAAMAAFRRSFAPNHTGQEHFEAMTSREQAQLARLDASRAHMEARFARLSMANFNPVVARTPRVVCPRIRVNVPSIPAIKIPTVQIPAAPIVRVDYAGTGPV